MAATITTSDGTNLVNVTAVTKTITYISDGNPLLVLVGLGNTNSRVRNITYNGVALTQVGQKNGGSYDMEAWQLVAPASGSNSLVINWTTATTAVFGIYNITGGDVGVLTADNLFFGSGSSTAPSVTVTSRTGDTTLVLCYGGAVVSQTFTSGASQTRIFTNTGASSNPKFASDTKAGAASVTVSYTLGTSTAWGILGVNLGTPSGTEARTTQLPVEVIGSGAKEVRVSQLPIEVIGSGAKSVRLSQLPLEVITPNSVSPIRISQIALEPVGSGLKEIRLSQLVIEIVAQNITITRFPPQLLAM